MNKCKVVFDLTSVHAPLRGSVLTRLNQFCQLKRISPAQVTFVSNTAQGISLGTDWTGSRMLTAQHDFDVNNVLRGVIEELQNLEICDAIYLISFNSTLLMIADEFDASSIRVLSRHGTTFDKSVGNSEARIVTGPINVGWRFDRFISKRDAMLLLERVLKGAEAYTQQSGLRQTLIRPALARYDSRWSGKGIETGTQGIIRSLVDCAVEDGLIEVDRGGSDPNNPLIWMTVAGRRLAQESSQALYPPAAAQHPPKGDLEANLTAVPDFTSPPRGDARKLSEEELIFREIKWGPFATERWLMYQAIEETIVDLKGEPIAVNKLIDSARKIVSKKLQDQSASKGSDDPSRRRPWPAIVTMFNALLPRSGALIGENGERIKPEIEAPLKNVYGLDVDFFSKADAVLVEAYLGKVKSIPQSKIFDLAGSLYFDRTPEMQSRVIQAMKILESRGRIAYSILEDGSEEIRLITPKPVLAFSPKSEIDIADVSMAAN